MPPTVFRLQMERISKRFAATVALEGVDLAVKPGEIHALVGENGAGKSTLMKILAGACRQDGGRIELDGQAYAPRSPLEGRQSGVAMIYQELALAPHLSIEENILLGVEPARWGLVDRKRQRSIARQAMQQLGLTHLDPETPVREISIASRQLVEIARAMAVGCRILILDEPTSSLTREDVPKLFALIRQLRDRGYSIIYISHFLEEVMELADGFTVLRDGSVAAKGEIRSTSTSQLAQWMVGRSVDDLYVRSTHTPGEVILEVAELEGLPLPVDVSLTLRRGEVLGIAGLVGAGRTELLRVLFGLAKAKRGRIRVGVFAGAASPAERWLQGMGLVSEDRKSEGLALGLSVADNLTLTKLSALGKGGFVSPSRQESVTDHWINRMGIRCRSPFQKVADLSGGNQQKVALARLLFHDADILLLDEPTRGVDVGSKAEIYRLIDRQACGDLAAGIPPKAVLMISSYLPELLGVCDRIAVMSRGRLNPPQPVEAVTEHSIMLEATGSVVN